MPAITGAPSSRFDVEMVLSQLGLDEKIGLLSGTDFWHTKGIPRLGVPAMRLSDGPNGIRGTKLFNGVAASCLPCGTALGSIWDVDLLEEAGRLLGAEARAKGVHIVLGPTVNIQRSPLGGRGFESFSEDPFLSGTLAAGYIRGVQSQGVAACIKHFVCNDLEHERKAVNVLVSDRALREIYLLPFQIALRGSEPWGLMTSYNKVNGTHVSEHLQLLKSVLREEWGYNGLVVSDWFGTYSTSQAIKAGLDLEMPGPAAWRGYILKQALRSNKISESDIDDRARNVLRMTKRAIESKIPEHAVEEVGDEESAAPILRLLASSSIVLLRNEKSFLPLQKGKTVAVIGPNAKAAVICGGGSAALPPTSRITPFDAISQRNHGTVTYAKGCNSHNKLPTMGMLLRTACGKPGYNMMIYREPSSVTTRQPIDCLELDNTEVILSDYRHKDLETALYYVSLEALFVPEDSGTYEFGLTVYGTGKLYIDGELVIDNATKQTPGDSFWGAGTREEIGSRHFSAGTTYKLMVDFGTAPTQATSAVGTANMGSGGFRLGCAKRVDPDTELALALEVARNADQVVICIGLNSDWESEGFDRKNMALPSLSDRLISEVAAVNPNTAVVVQSGTPVSMPWVNEVPAILQAWYGGNETGNAIADVLYGDVNPSGKLPLTMPVRDEDNPAFLNSRSEASRMLYGEDIYVGYRFYEMTATPVLFPFGHGLSYSKFRLENLHLTEQQKAGGPVLHVAIDLHNDSEVDGHEVVQVYVRQRNPSIKRPKKELKGFKRALVVAGGNCTVEMELDKKRVASYWDERKSMWLVEGGSYEILVGTSSNNIVQKADFTVAQTEWWKGL